MPALLIRSSYTHTVILQSGWSAALSALALSLSLSLSLSLCLSLCVSLFFFWGLLTCHPGVGHYIFKCVPTEYGRRIDVGVERDPPQCLAFTLGKKAERHSKRHRERDSGPTVYLEQTWPLTTCLIQTFTTPSSDVHGDVTTPRWANPGLHPELLSKPILPP